MGGLRWGLIGASAIAREWVIPAMKASTGHELVGVASSDPSRGSRFACENGISHAYEGVDALLADERIEAVYISTTSELHAGQTIAAAKAGKHVFCEKPLALSVADAHASLAACEEAKVVLGANHHFRNDSHVRAARELVAEGAIGRPLAARISQAVLLPARLRRWRLSGGEPGAGVIFDLTVHDVDTLRFVLGDEVSEVLACKASQVFGEGKVEDAALGVMAFEGGLLASFYDAYNVADAGSSLEVHGSAGSIVIEEALDERLIARGRLRKDGEQRTLDAGEPIDLYEYGLRRFAKAVAGVGSPAASGEDGLRSLAVAAAIQRATTTRGTVAVEY